MNISVGGVVEEAVVLGKEKDGMVDVRNVTSDETDWVVVDPATEVDEDSGLALFHYHLMLTLSLGISVLVSLVLVTAVVYYLAFVWIPRRQYKRLEEDRKRKLSFLQLLEEVRGRPRRESAGSVLTESERHFLIHDFADFP
ncbi:hypothetical protein Pmani_011111 [Petrolisthes manimaculis]|uniref:Uncharacterized protein n=1 Tax=Petrolisthes manimaculis TaxID=1843537 RepID=A0AAE1Q1V2_9EUCA|nr:hypothetical protein Pmani_011111 [Petrolisthes manimaculis]